MKNVARLKALLVDLEKAETAREQIGDIIARFRADNDITQKALAQQLDISPQYLSDVEAGRRGLSDVMRLRLLTVLDGRAA